MQTGKGHEEVNKSINIPNNMFKCICGWLLYKQETGTVVCSSCGKRHNK